jgi:protein KRI1
MSNQRHNKSKAKAAAKPTLETSSSSSSDSELELKIKDPSTSHSNNNKSNSRQSQRPENFHDSSSDEFNVQIKENPTSSRARLTGKSSQLMSDSSAEESSSESSSSSSSSSTRGRPGQPKLTINEGYAAKLESEKRQQELSKKSQKNRKKSAMAELLEKSMISAEEEREISRNVFKGVEEGDEIDYDSQESEESEDSEAQLLTQEIDEKIQQTLRAIKLRKSEIYDKSRTFFAEDETAGKNSATGQKKTKLSVQKYLVNSLEGAEHDSDAEDDKTIGRTHVEEQKLLKKSFKSAAKVLEEESEEDLFAVKIKAPQELVLEAAEQAKFNSEQAEKRRNKAQSLSSVDFKALSNEEYLELYSNSALWKASKADLPDYSVITGRSEGSTQPEVEEEEEFLQKTNYFEAEIQSQNTVQYYPRVIGDSLRTSDSKRKIQREKRAEQRREEEIRRAEELKKAKSEKWKEFEGKVKEIELIIGRKIEIPLNLLYKKFESGQHEEIMAQIIGENYEEEELAGNEEEIINNIRKEENLAAENSENEELPQNNRPVIKPGSFLRQDEENLKKKLKKTKQKKGELDPELAAQLGEIQQTVEQLNSLDYEDIVGGSKVRFHYRAVQPSGHGLSLEEILNKPDKELNQRSSFKQLAPYTDLYGHSSANQVPAWKAALQQKQKYTQKAGKTYENQEKAGETSGDRENQGKKRKFESQEKKSASADAGKHPKKQKEKSNNNNSNTNAANNNGNASNKKNESVDSSSGGGITAAQKRRQRKKALKESKSTDANASTNDSAMLD